MAVITKYISDYMEFLYDYGLQVTLHGSICSHEDLMPYVVHQNPYCHYIKSLSNINVCAIKQTKVYNKCAEGEFYGICFAGVAEYVYPVHHNNTVVGFISVGGYYSNSDIAKQKLLHFAEKYNTNYNALKDLQTKYLKHNIPPKATLDALIHPLVVMLEDFYLNFDLEHIEYNDIYRLMLNYISENYHEQITMQLLSKHLNFSVSTLSHIFKKRCSKSLSEYVETIRLNEAKRLLCETNFTIAEISNIIGFCNSNYFSTIFKKRLGITPKAYRTKHIMKIDF